MSRNHHFRFGPAMGRPKHLGTAYGPAASGSAEGDILEGLREDDADVRMRGLREDDADVRLRGLREDDADVRMRGLREEDADVHMGDVDTLSSEGGRIEQEQPGMEGLREDDADVRMGDLEDTTRWDGSTGRAEGSAEGHRDYQMGQPSVMVSDGRMGFTVGTSYAPAAEGSAEGDILGVSAYDELGGLREDDADVRMRGLREDDADVRMRGLREDDADVRMRGIGVSAYDELGVSAYDEMGRNRRVEVGVSAYDELGVSAYDELGRRRRFSPGRLIAMKKKMLRLRGAEEEPPKLGAEGFHERFPVTVEIKGLGRIDTGIRGGDLQGWFDFLRSMPSDEEYMGKIKVVLSQWDQAKPDLMSLHESSRVAIANNMNAAQADLGRYESLRGFLAEGAAAKTLGRWDRVVRLEAYLPTLRTLIAQAKALGAAPTQTAEQKRVNETALTDVAARQQAMSKPNVWVDTVLPIGAVATGTAAVTGILLAVI